MNLRIPGPTPLPDEVLQASGKQMVDHRGPEFKAMFDRITSGLKEMFQTKNDVLILSSSGTGSMEAAIANTLSAGDRVLAVSIGEFGERFAAIATAFGANVTKLNFPMGTHATPEGVREALAKDPSFKAVLITHNETSTGITNDLGPIAAVVKGEFNKLLIVDGISSVGSIECKTDEWKLDVVLSGSQKGWMAAPGLAFVAMSPTAWEANKTSKMPKYYFDLAKAKVSADNKETPWTPAMSVFYALDKGVEILKKEGYQNVYKRHAELSAKTRNGLKALGLKMVATEDKYASNTVTAVYLPEGIEDGALRKHIQSKYQVVLAGGRGALTGKVFRIGHLGYVTAKDIDECIEAVRGSLIDLGVKLPITK